MRRREGVPRSCTPEARLRRKAIAKPQNVRDARAALDALEPASLLRGNRLHGGRDFLEALIWDHDHAIAVTHNVVAWSYQDPAARDGHSGLANAPIRTHARRDASREHWKPELLQVSRVTHGPIGHDTVDA